MPRAKVIASASTDVQGLGAGATLYGVQAVSATATSTVVLRHGTTGSDPIVGRVVVPAAPTPVRVDFPALELPNGLFIDRDGSVSVELILYHA